jgi:hypothetical protein
LLLARGEAVLAVGKLTMPATGRTCAREGQASFSFLQADVTDEAAMCDAMAATDDVSLHVGRIGKGRCRSA